MSSDPLLRQDAAAPQAINLANVLATFSAPWSPRIVTAANGHDYMVGKGEGAFPWHKHAEFDDVFLVIEGVLDVEFRDRTIRLGPGELLVVPRGMEHRPVASCGSASFLLIEPSGAPNSDDPATATTKTSLIGTRGEPE